MSTPSERQDAEFEVQRVEGEDDEKSIEMAKKLPPQGALKFPPSALETAVYARPVTYTVPQSLVSML